MTLRAFVADVLAAVRAEVPSARRVAFTAPVEPRALEVFLAAKIPGELLCWDAGPGWSFAGRAEALRIEASGGTRFADVRTRARLAFEETTCRDAPGCGADAPALAFHGGASFVPGGRDAAWRGFADASFVLPRWLFARNGDRALLRLTVDVRELDSPRSLLDEIDRVEAAIADAGPTADETSPTDTTATLDELSPEAWRAMVQDALGAIGRGAFEKVVLARRSRLEPGPGCASIRPVTVLERLRATQPGCVRFAFERAGRAFVGATPERLFVLRDARLETEALAGSIARRSHDDAAAIANLVGSEKDQREHALVVDGIVAQLRSVGGHVEDPGVVPRVRTLRQVHHLWTPLVAQVPRGLHPLELLDALHPTAALAGAPREASCRYLVAHEPVARGWYGAPVGWFDARCNGSFAVAIRSALLEPRGAWLYAGAGIVRGSDAASEYAETRVKQSAMLSVLAPGAVP